jgi:hypothetical protein
MYIIVLILKFTPEFLVLQTKTEISKIIHRFCAISNIIFEKINKNEIHLKC